MIKRKQIFAYINKIAQQIQKLRIIWVKTLNKLQLLDEYDEVLQEMGIVVGGDDFLEE